MAVDICVPGVVSGTVLNGVAVSAFIALSNILYVNVSVFGNGSELAFICIFPPNTFPLLASWFSWLFIYSTLNA